MTSKDKRYRTIATLSKEISDKLDKVDRGTCSLSEMDDLLNSLRELEERVIIIRYKGMEHMRYPEPVAKPSKVKVAEPYRAPELPLDADEPAPEAFETVEELQGETKEPVLSAGGDAIEEVAPNQISLIDSIEEISQEASINERMQNKHKRSVAQRLQSKPIKSVLKALNLNQKMGLINQVFGGDEAVFKKVMKEIDAAPELKAAQDVVNSIVTDDQREELPIVRKLDSLVERRFL